MSDYANPLLNEREQTHGDYAKVSECAQDIKWALRNCAEHWDSIKPEMRESLDMIAVKMARIVCGDAHARQHIEDIIGYAQLAETVCGDADD